MIHIRKVLLPRKNRCILSHLVNRDLGGGVGETPLGSYKDYYYFLHRLKGMTVRVPPSDNWSKPSMDIN